MTVSQLQQLILARDADEALISNGDCWLVTGTTTSAHPSPFANDDAVRACAVALARAAGTRLDPMVGATGGALDDGAWRWHAVLPPLSRDGVLFSLRRHRFATLTLDDFAITAAARRDLLAACQARRHIVIVGATGSGKSSLLMALLSAFAVDERVVIMESLSELPRLSPRWVRLAARTANLEGLGAFSLSQLLVEALRLRPDRLVIGEVRGPEAGVLVDAFATGHAGVVATLHAGDAETAHARLRRWDVHGGDGGAGIVFVQVERCVPPVVRLV